MLLPKSSPLVCALGLRFNPIIFTYSTRWSTACLLSLCFKLAAASLVSTSHSLYGDLHPACSLYASSLLRPHWFQPLSLSMVIYSLLALSMLQACCGLIGFNLSVSLWWSTPCLLQPHWFKALHPGWSLYASSLLQPHWFKALHHACSLYASSLLQPHWFKALHHACSFYASSLLQPHWFQPLSLSMVIYTLVDLSMLQACCSLIGFNFQPICGAIKLLE